MRKSELDSILKRARTPECSEEFWEEFPRQIVRGLNQAPAKNYKVERNWFPRLAWGLATAICVFAVFAIGHWRGRMETQASTDVLANAKLVHETLAMFPNQVRAIVQDEHGLQLVLSDQPDVPMSTPLWVKICDGKQCASLVTFSGQELDIAGQKITVLSDAHDGIILEGSGFVWSSDDRPVHTDSRLKIEAHRLGPITL
jgi:hypothetical protein